MSTINWINEQDDIILTLVNVNDIRRTLKHIRNLVGYRYRRWLARYERLGIDVQEFRDRLNGPPGEYEVNDPRFTPLKKAVSKLEDATLNMAALWNYINNLDQRILAIQE